MKHNLGDNYGKEIVGTDIRWYDMRKSSEEIKKYIQPLIDQLTLYDRHRIKIETKGGTKRDIITLTNVLRKELEFDHEYLGAVSLSKPKDIGRALGMISPELTFDVRINRFDLPIYYLSRAQHYYAALYSLILEDLYISSGHPGIDRFVRLMDWGHEKFYLRLSQFRDQLPAGKNGWDKDDLLTLVNRHVFQSAWDPDQYLSVQTADHLGIPHLKQCSELIYLQANADLCSLRGAVMQYPAICSFFEDVYYQPSLYTFLKQIINLPGDALTTYQARAIKTYPKIASAFGKFLSETSIAWSSSQNHQPLYKILLSNLNRFEWITQELQKWGGSAMQSAVKQLDNLCQDLIRHLQEV